MKTYVNQAGAGVAHEGILQSNNHITCYNVIVINAEKSHAMMCHVWEGAWTPETAGFNQSHRNALKELIPEPGEKLGLLIEGARSSYSGDTVNLLKRCGVDVLQVMKLPTEGARWNVDFDIDTRKVKVEDEYGKVHYEGTPFPPRKHVPAQLAAMTLQQRVAHQLASYCDEKGELLPEAQQQLNDMLKRSHLFQQHHGALEGELIHHMMAARAKAAGFDDYTDYLEADKKNFIDVAPDSPELMLRKLRGGAGRQSFIERGVDVDAAKISPQAVVAMLGDYPHVLTQFVRKLETANRIQKA